MLIVTQKFLYDNPAYYFLDLIHNINNTFPNCEICDDSAIDETIVSRHDSVFMMDGSGFGHIKLYKDHKMKVISWIDDIHYWDEDSLAQRKILFDSSDVIVLPYYKQFLEMKVYSNYHSKGIWLPYHSPQYGLAIHKDWESKENKALLTGARSASYSFRISIEPSNSVEILNHPGYEGKFIHNIVGEKFFDYVASYKGGIVTSGNKRKDNGFNLEYTLMKYFEIPACGVIPFIWPTADTEELGFVDGLNCINISPDNYIKKIRDNLQNEEIALNSQKFMSENHTFNNRINILKQII